MKFLSECGGSCYRPTVAPPPPPPLSPEEQATTQTQVAFSKRKKLTSSKSGSASHWRPALSVISEDVVLVPHMECKSEKKSSSTKSRSMTKSRSYNYSDEYYSSRKSSVPMIIPAFSPTPFLF